MSALIELCPSAMLVLDKHSIVLANAPAEELFGSKLQGLSPAGILPEHILENPSPAFVASAIAAGKPCSVSARREDKLLFLSFSEDRSSEAPPHFISDSLISGILSSLCTLNLAAERMTEFSEDCCDDRIRGYISILNHSRHSLQRSLTNLSTAIALKKGSLYYARATVDLARMCSDICSTVSLLCADKGIEIGFSTRHGNLYAWVDGTKIERIILNLLSNAIANTAKGGSISMSLEKSGDTAYISVDDTGCGIPPARLPGLFTAYERENGDEALRSMSTGGLGLCVARGLAEGHGGALMIESRVGKGTSVRLVLPLHSSMLTRLESPAPAAPNSGMDLMLTELAPVLASDKYSPEYMD